jgi:hypothetical protein
MKMQIFNMLLWINLYADDSLEPPPNPVGEKQIKMESLEQVKIFNTSFTDEIDTLEIILPDNDKKPVYLNIKNRIKLVVDELKQNLAPTEVTDYDVLCTIRFGTMKENKFKPIKNDLQIFLLKSQWILKKNHEKQGEVIRCIRLGGFDIDYAFIDNEKIINTKFS